jgi:uncharacterized protein YegP (UPF0339 family)
MAGQFELKRTDNEQFMFNLKATNGQIILTSQRYQAKDSARAGIESVKKHATDDASFERKTSASNQPYFVLKTANGQIIGQSEMYSSVATMENGIATVKANALMALVVDLGVKQVAANSTGWDVFICHASEGKALFVEPLALNLKKQSLKVWYDDFALELGDSLRRSIDRGLAESRFGIVVLSPAFFEKDWPQYELDGLAQRERQGRKVILPVWHNISHADILKYSPSLADKKAVSSSKGIPVVTASILRVVRPTHQAEY